MNSVLLCMRNFELGTRLSDVFTRLEWAVRFVDDYEVLGKSDDPPAKLAVVDLDDPLTGSVHFIASLKGLNPHITIIGYLKWMHKNTHDKFKVAGCDIILPQSSLVKNIPSLIRNLSINGRVG
ncbi:MAG: hypothetical protein GXO92_03020 [FCB group bacterium]|nr:hypothetical protein [FCB group bacterium]